MTKFFWQDLKLCAATFLNTLLLGGTFIVIESPPANSQAADGKSSIYWEQQLSHSSESNNLASYVSQGGDEIKIAQAQRENIAPSIEDPEAKSKISDSLALPSMQGSMEQVSSVSQLSDVQPTDWAFQALQSLVERYGCIAGYPDGTFRGERALSRYEFAAGLNACLDRINELIVTGTNNLVRKEDLILLQKLQEEYAAELATLRGRVEATEVQAATLESQQFSTTTKLTGQLVTYLSDAFGDTAGPINNTNLGYLLRFDLNTSFTGQDNLRTRLQATNLRVLDTGATFGGNPNRSFTGKSDETRFQATSPIENGEVSLAQLEYRFPIGKKLRIYVEFGGTDPTYITDPVSPFADQATASLSLFSPINPVYFPVGNQAGIAFKYSLTPAISFDGGYLAEGASGPNNPNRGLFKGGYSAFTQLVYQGERLKFSLLYINSYSPEFGVDTLVGSNAAKVIGAGPVVGSNYGFQVNYKISPGFELGGWVGYTFARALTVKGDADIWNYNVTLNFPDLFKLGNLGGIAIGMQPRLTGTSNNNLAQAIGLPTGQRKDRDIGIHVEAFYRFQLNDYISVTPGFFWLTAPNHDARNPDVVVGVIRTTFTF
jgi:Carbohydrate-selective porin, OprB family/S-layer homology domain